MTYSSDPVADVKDRFRRHLPFWENEWKRMQKRRDFLLGDRFENDNGAYEKDRRLIQIRGQETSDEIRHVLAKCTEKARNVQARPIDKIDDPADAEAAVATTAWMLDNPYSGFETPYERALLACREESIGIVWMDYDPNDMIHKYKFRHVPGDRAMWDPTFWDDPHHPDCGWLIEICRYDTEKSKKEYKAPWLISDYASDRTNDADTGRPLRQYAEPYGPITYEDNKTTLWKCWYKNDDTEKPEGKVREEEPLPDDERYMSCGTLDEPGCGYRSKTQAQLLEEGSLDTELPEFVPGAEMGEGEGCPDCGREMTRIDVVQTVDYIRAYEKGRRLVIIAPNCPSPTNKPLYDGPWPVPSARSFPAFFITPYVKPGWSDVDEHWDAQIAADQLRTLALERVFEHRDIWILPSAGINDANGKRFVFRNNQRNVAFRDQSMDQFGPLGIEHMNGTGLDPSWPIVMQSTLQTLTQYRAAADFGPSDERTRDLPVGTTQQLVKQAEISTAHFVRRRNRELSKFYGVVFDYGRATITPDTAARLRQEGIDIVVNMAGDAMPNFDFVIEDTPDFTGLEEAKGKAWEALMGTIAQAQQLGLPPAEMIEAQGELQGFPRSVIRQVVTLVQQAEEKAAQTQDQAMAGAVPGGAALLGEPEGLGGEPSGEPGLDEFGDELNGAGIGPAFIQ